MQMNSDPPWAQPLVASVSVHFVFMVAMPLASPLSHEVGISGVGGTLFLLAVSTSMRTHALLASSGSSQVDFFLALAMLAHIMFVSQYIIQSAESANQFWMLMTTEPGTVQASMSAGGVDESGMYEHAPDVGSAIAILNPFVSAVTSMPIVERSTKVNLLLFQAKKVNKRTQK